jgi:hypothetical protein
MYRMLTEQQYGGSPVKVGDEEYALFRDYEYVYPEIISIFAHSSLYIIPVKEHHAKFTLYRLLAKINE